MRILIRNRQRHRSLDKSKITRAAHTILLRLKQPMAELSLMFVGEKRMKELNRKYRGINRSTDVLTFEARIPVDNSHIYPVLGDIVINVPRAERQAESSGLLFYDEVTRLLIHGVLHLVGYEHEDSRDKARMMEKKEEELFYATQKMDTEH